MYVIHLAKEPFKFSCSHFTVFSKDHAERLHGHNYQVRVDIEMNDVKADLGMAFDFNDVKPMIRRLCDDLDERILVPAHSPYVSLKTVGSNIEVRFADKQYSFPVSDTAVIPVSNISSEELARLLWERLAKEMADLPHWTVMQVNVEETRGQSVSYRLAR